MSTSFPIEKHTYVVTDAKGAGGLGGRGDGGAQRTHAKTKRSPFL